MQLEKKLEEEKKARMQIEKQLNELKSMIQSIPHSK